ncbi:MAG TPA: DUF1580 domain-containing protein, partial [Urbifossiella sp.]|nr:DUF1580 domain-containing protein [Urbifossiella sp.]
MAEPATQIDVTTVLGEIMAGGGLTLAQAGKLFPSHRGGGHTDPATVWRWARTGTRTPDGRIVRLEVVRVGVRWLTSRAAVTRYVGAL